MTGRRYGFRIALGLAVLAAGYLSVADSLANVVGKVDAKSAYRLAVANGPVTAKFADQQFARLLDSNPASEPARLARLALNQDATAVDALTVLGLQAQLRNDTETARAYFSQSLALSRRELQPRIWAIEEAVGRGDIEEAIRNYDIALRTSKSAADLLFPILGAAISEPRIRTELLDALARKPAWAKQFVDFAALSTIDPQSTALLFQEGRRINLPVDETNRITLVNALLAREQYEDAWVYYAKIRRGAVRDRSRDPDFSLAASARSPFDWRALPDEALSASLQRSETGGLMEFFAPASTGGKFFEQMQFLQPGTYRISGRTSGIQQKPTALPYWVLTCIDGRELGRVSVPNSAIDDGRFAGKFSVPSGCDVQILAFMARPSEEIGGVTGQMLRAQILPVQSAAK